MMPIVNGFTISQKTYKNNANSSNMSQKVNPSFCAIPKNAILRYADGLVDKTKDVFDTKKIIKITEDCFEAIDNSMLYKNNAPEKDKCLIECLRHEVMNTFSRSVTVNSGIEEAISQKYHDVAKDPQYLAIQKKSLKSTVEKIKNYIEKWTCVEQYINNPNQGIPAPDGFESFKDTSNMFSRLCT